MHYHLSPPAKGQEGTEEHKDTGNCCSLPTLPAEGRETDGCSGNMCSSPSKAGAVPWEHRTESVQQQVNNLLHPASADWDAAPGETGKGFALIPVPGIPYPYSEGRGTWKHLAAAPDRVLGRKMDGMWTWWKYDNHRLPLSLTKKKKAPVQFGQLPIFPSKKAFPTLTVGHKVFLLTFSNPVIADIPVYKKGETMFEKHLLKSLLVRVSFLNIKKSKGSIKVFSFNLRELPQQKTVLYRQCNMFSIHTQERFSTHSPKQLSLSKRQELCFW